MEKNSKTWVIGDIHGEYDKLKRLLELIEFDYENDQLISLGDIVDRGPNSYECVEELLKIKNLIALRGNHDEAFRESTITGRNSLYTQGGRETMLSYQRSYPKCDNDPTKIPQTHKDFFKNQINYYVDINGNLFVHAGIDITRDIEKQDLMTFIWDREMIMDALNPKCEFDNIYKNIFIGHTPTIYWEDANNKPFSNALAFRALVASMSGLPLLSTKSNASIAPLWRM